MTAQPKTASANGIDHGFRTIEDGASIAGPHLRALYDYWSEARREARFAPPGHHFMLEFPREAALWSISNVCDGGQDFRYRFAGSEIVNLIGLDPTGHLLSELVKTLPPSQFATNTKMIFKMVAETGLPVINGPRQISIDEKSYIRIQSLNLPLGTDTALPQQILGAVELLEAEIDVPPNS